MFEEKSPSIVHTHVFQHEHQPEGPHQHKEGRSEQYRPPRDSAHAHLFKHGHAMTDLGHQHDWLTPAYREADTA